MGNRKRIIELEQRVGELEDYFQYPYDSLPERFKNWIDGVVQSKRDRGLRDLDALLQYLGLYVETLPAETKVVKPIKKVVRVATKPKKQAKRKRVSP